MNDSVSIVIPTYNRRDLVGSAIESALDQTHKNCEVVVVDDGSTDGTAEYISSTFGSKIKLHITSNKGVSSARNLGSHASSGEYVKFLDSDDCLTSDSIEKLVSHAMTAESNRLVIGRAYEEDADGIMVESTSYNLSPPSYKGLLSTGATLRKVIPVCLPLYSRRALLSVGGFDDRFSISEDYELAVRLMLKGFEFFQIQNYCYEIRGREHTRLSRSLSKGKFEQLHVVMEKVTEIVKSERFPGDRSGNLLAVAQRTWSLGRLAARLDYEKEAHDLFTLARATGGRRAQVGSIPLRFLYRVLDPHKAEATATRIKRFLGGKL
jgi:glycosyltransferase involved in cell wall biosynthesis